MQNPTRSESTAASSTRDVLGTGQEINMITNLQKHIDGWVLNMMSELWLIETPLAKAVLKDSKESSFLQAGLWNWYDRWQFHWNDWATLRSRTEMMWNKYRYVDTYCRARCAAFYVFTLNCIMIWLHIHTYYSSIICLYMYKTYVHYIHTYMIYYWCVYIYIYI